MLAKYTLRWKFYRMAAVLCKDSHHNLMRKVVNPRNDYKLNEVAFRHQIDLVRFQRVCRHLRRIISNHYAC